MRWCDTNCEQCHGARTGLLNSIIHDSRTAIQTEREQNTKPELHIKWWPNTAVYHKKINQKCLSNQALQVNTFTFNCTLPPICKIITMNRKTENFIIRVTQFAPKQDQVWCIASNWYPKHNVGSVYLTMLTLMVSCIKHWSSLRSKQTWDHPLHCMKQFCMHITM